MADSSASKISGVSTSARRTVCRSRCCGAAALCCLLMPFILPVNEGQTLYPGILLCRGSFLSYLANTVSGSRPTADVIESVTPAELKRFVDTYSLIKKHLAHYYAGVTPGGDILYFIELNTLDSSIVERGLLTIRDLELHLQLVRQIVWDCLISLDVQPRMHIFADLRGLNAGSIGAFWSTRFTVLRHILRSLRDKTLTKREHQVTVAVISDSPLVRAVVEIKRHKFPRNSRVRVYNSLSDMFRYHENGVWSPSILPKKYGGSADTDLENGGFEFLIRTFVEQILSRDYGAIDQCVAVGASTRIKETQTQSTSSADKESSKKYA